MLPGLVLAALVLSAGLRGVPGAVVLALVSMLWLMVNGPMEGKVLLTLTATHGLTAADLAGLAGLVLAVGRVVGRRTE